MDEYYKEMYAIAIDEHFIYYKCPFSHKNLIHKILNKTYSLVNREEVLECDCELCGEKIVINIGDFTERQTLKQNKKNTSFSVDKSSIKRTRLLHNLEIDGSRQFNKTQPLL